MAADLETTNGDLLARGMQYQRAQDFVRAEHCYRELLRVHPQHTTGLYQLATSLQAQGKLADAIDHFRCVVELTPEHVDGHTSLGIALGRLGRTKEAVASLREAIRLKPDYAKAHNNLGVALGALGKRDEAVAAWGEAIRLQPDYSEAYFNQAVVLSERGDKSEAEAAYRKAIQIRPDYAEAHNNLGLLMNESGRTAEAIMLLRQAARLNPDYVDAHNNLGLALVDMGRADEALACYERALQLRPTDVDLHSNLGTALAALGRLEESLGSYQVGLLLQPDHPETHWHRSLSLLQLGDFAQGWQEYEWRWKRKRGTPRNLPKPLWDGSFNKDQTILLYCEQGLGDTLQFIRYARLVKERAGTVILESPPGMIPLLSTCSGIDRLVAERDPLPDYHAQSPLLSLPAILKSARPLSAPTPYLKADPQLVQQWQEEIKQHAGFKVGIAWQGNPKHRWDRHRSFPLRVLLALSEVPGVQLFSLQKGHGADQVQDAPAEARLIDLGSRLDAAGGMSDAAAVVQSLDLVITCDSALAHLAGALGKPAWVLIAHLSDWRWLKDREDSPWYPSLRLFRQKTPGDWQEVIARVRSDLADMTRGSPASAPPVQESYGYGAYCPASAPPDQPYYALQATRAAQADETLRKAHACREAGELQHAVFLYKKALEDNPEHAGARFHLGEVLARSKNPVEAAAHFREAIQLQPGFAEAHLFLAQALEEQKQAEDAIRSYRRFLEMQPNHAEAHNRLGILLASHGALDDAIAHFQTLVKLQPDRAGAYHNIAVALTDQDKLGEAMPLFEETLRRDPNYAEGHKGIGMAFLKMGRFAEGWQEYEWRWKCDDFTPPETKQPLWDGSPLKDKTILLHTEQGVGDTFQFIRYAPLVKERMGPVILACPVSLYPLLGTCAGIDRLVDKKAELPSHDVQAPLLSLPYIFKTELASIPVPVPYLHADPKLVDGWRRELTPIQGFKVGIIWQGNPGHSNDARRSIQLKRFEPLAKVPGVRLLSLQKGPGIEQLAQVQGRFSVVDLSSRMDGVFVEAAAIMKNLDLVISCDTGGGHLAGALGVPVWIALNTPSDWRWLSDRDDTPWYPTMRLFRQPVTGDWDTVFQHMTEALQALVADNIRSQAGHETGVSP